MKKKTVSDLIIERDIALATSARYVRYAAKCIEQSDNADSEEAADATKLAKQWRAKADTLDEELRSTGFDPEA